MRNARALRFLSSPIGRVTGLAGLTAIVACSSSAAPQSPATQGTGTLSSSATYLDSTQAADVDVEASYLSFPAATHADMMNHVAGDILVGDRGAAGGKNPWGFLRKVTAFPVQQGGAIVIQTTAARLQDVVSQATFKTTLQAPELTMTGPAAPSSAEIHPLASPSTSGGTTIQLLDFSGTKLVNASNSVTLASGDTVGYTAQATVTTGTLDFSPSFDIGADIEPNLTDPLASLQEFHVIATGALAADLELNLGMTLTGNMTGTDLANLIAQGVFQSPTTTLASYPIDLGSISLGIIDIPVHAQFTATLACDLSYGGGLGVDVGGKANASVTAGFEYQASAATPMTPVFSHTESFTMIGPTWTMDSAVHVRCSVKPEFDLSFYDLAAGSIYADPHVSIDASATCSASALTGTVTGSAQAGVDAVASANVDVLGLYTWSKTCTLFDVESPTATVSGTFALPGGANTSCVSNPPPGNPALAAPPANCFTGAGSSTGTGTGTGTGTSDDAGTGAGSDSGSPAPAGDGGTCDHSACVSGDALGPTCTLDNQGGACIAAICKNDSFCCSFTWDGSCIAHITNGDFGCLPSDCP